MWIRTFLPQLCLLLVFLGPTSKILPAQTTDTIKVINSLGKVYKYDGKYLGRLQLRRVLKQDPAAFAMAQKGDGFYAAQGILEFTGGFLWGYALSEYIIKHEVRTDFILIGAGFVALGLPFAFIWKSYAKKAVLLFNENRTELSTLKTEIKAGLTSSGIGVRLSF